MTQDIDRHPAPSSLLDIVERATLFALLQQALAHRKPAPELPRRLYEDLGLTPSERSGFTPHGW